MKAKVIYVLLVVALGVLYYFSNSYVNTIEAETALLASQNNSIELSILESKVEFTSEYETFKSYKESLHILPDRFDWNRKITELEAIESKLGIEIIKDLSTEIDVEEESRFYPLNENIRLYKVYLTVELTPYTLNLLIQEISNLESITIIDYVYGLYTENNVKCNMQLVYFVYEEVIEE